MSETKVLKMPDQREIKFPPLQDTKAPAPPPLQDTKAPAVPHPPEQDRVRVKILDFEIKKAGSMEYVFEDETTVKFTPQLNQVLVEIDEKGNIVLGSNGLPLFSFNCIVQTQVFPKNRMLYVARQQPTAGTTPTSIAL